MGSIISYKGISDESPALYYASPYSATGRVNLTILASDDNGATFARSLNLWPTDPGRGAGYTGLACGLKGANDCGLLFDSQSHGLDFVTFSSKDVK